ncbi:hypothetical protein PTKIN_Ptkin01aG0125200 [Pterospermum kingtungense]
MDLLDDPVGPVKEILELCPKRLLVTIYKILGFESVDQFLQNVASVRGKLKKGDNLDVEVAARIVLQDWNEESSFMASLKSANDFHSVEVPPSHPFNFDETMLEDDVKPLPSTEGDGSRKDMFAGGNDEPMASEEDDDEKAKSICYQQAK